MAPEIPTAIYKLAATGLPVCPTCSLCGLHPMSDTGFEHAVAAPRTEAKSSIMPQFSGPFIPRPAETTISASAMVTFPDTFSTLCTLIPKSASFKDGVKLSSVNEDAFSINPKEFFAIPNTFTAVLISVKLNALFEKAVLLTWKGEVLSGNATTLDA